MGNPWINGEFTFNMRDNLLFEKDEKNFIDALGIQQLDTIGHIYFLDIFLMEGNSVEFHYHPNASELTYCIAGEVEIGFLNPSENEWQRFVLAPREVVSIPQGFWHYARALKDDTHLLATHDTDNLQTMFGSDILRETPRNLMAETYCLDEAALEKVLDPIDETVIIGPPEDCDKDALSNENKAEAVQSKMERTKMMEQPSKMEEELDKGIWRQNDNMNHRPEAVPFGGTVVREMNLCESCMKKFSS